MSKQGKLKLGTAKAIAKGLGFTWKRIVEDSLVDEFLCNADLVLEYLQTQGVVIKVTAKEDGLETFVFAEECMVQPLIEEKE